MRMFLIQPILFQDRAVNLLRSLPSSFLAFFHYGHYSGRKISIRRSCSYGMKDSSFVLLFGLTGYSKDVDKQVKGLGNRSGESGKCHMQVLHMERRRILIEGPKL